MARHIKEVIETYEPRLCDVDVQIRPAAEVEAERDTSTTGPPSISACTAALNLRPHKG